MPDLEDLSDLTTLYNYGKTRFEVFTNSLQYKNANIAICGLAVPFKFYWATEVINLKI